MVNVAAYYLLFTSRCRALHFLGKQVSLITAPGNVPLLRALLECEARIYGYEIPLIEAPLISQVKDRHEWALETIAPYDHIISIEILGAARYVYPSAFGLYCNVYV